ncbi:neuropeptide FF receptor 2-like [Wyeomyia smithii]|uniref:neuropeptide FF receptor 2-like n=1 Tax=Wyeomyia smithii TaxID=174621 RepID=UPI002467E56C|nr:neuropeptide FF receptor 2-like [Wyeomyia smithii]
MKTGFNLQPENAPLELIPSPRIMWSSPVPIDTSLYDYPTEVWDQIPDRDIIIKLTVLIPIVLFGILGNITLLEIVLSNRTLRTSTHLLIANLALIDLVTLVLCPPMFLLHDIHQRYVLGQIGCKVEGFVEGGLLITSILALCVVSYDRLAAIVLPARARMTRNCVILAIVLCWALGFAAALPLAIYRNYRERNWANFRETYCSENHEVMPIYWDYIVVLLVWMPLGVMVVTYSAILYKLDRYEKEALNREHPMVVRFKSRVVKTLFVVLMTFVVVRIPFTIMIMVYYKNVDDSNKFKVNDNIVLLWWLAKMAFIFLYSAMNPVIYGLTNRTFRKAYKSSKILGTLLRLSENTEKSPQEKPVATSRKALWPREPCEGGKTNKENRMYWGSRNRYIVANWLNSTIRYKDKRRSVANQREQNNPPAANNTKSSEMVPNN